MLFEVYFVALYTPLLDSDSGNAGKSMALTIQVIRALTWLSGCRSQMILEFMFLEALF